MSRWFRHYAGMMRDDKLVSVAIKSKQTVERVVWIWGAILESAAEIDSNGRFDVDPAEIAYFLRADEADVCAVIDGLESAGRVASGAVVKWGDRQFQSDRSAARQAAYRERKRAEGTDRNAKQTSCDDGVTLQLRHADAPETETETETELPEANASGAAPPSAADIRKAIFDTGKAILKAAGHDDRSAGSIVGRWRKNYSDSEVLTVLSRCQAEQPSEPVEWVPKALQLERAKTTGTANGFPARQPHLRPSAGSRGERPNLCLDMVRAAEAEIRAAEDREPDWEARPPLRAIGSG